MRLDQWNERYRTREAIDLEPAAVLVHAVAEGTPGRALDLACGAGRNALWLARQGWDVMAIDGAEEAIRIVQGHDANIATRVLDLERDEPLPFDEASFDLVVILYFLHRPLFAEAERVLRPGGMLVTAVRTGGISARYCMSLDALRAELAHWEIVQANDGEIAEVVARKPGRSRSPRTGDVP